MRSPLAARRSLRGTTLIEAMIAMAVLIVAFLALAGLQVSGVRSARFGDRMVQATSMATDLEENIKLWQYSDARLNATDTLTNTNLVANWDLGNQSAPTPTPQNDDSKLGTYLGLSRDVDRDGTNDFQRYWTVHAIDPTGAGGGNEDGKLVQIWVRWKQPGSKAIYRQVSTMTFLRNPGKVF